MARRHMSDLMCHHASQFRFLVRCEDQTGIHIEEPARQGEGIDLIGVDDLDRERNLRIRIALNILAHPVNILGDHRILNQLNGRLYLLGILPTQGDLFLDAIPVANAGLATYVAVANSVDIRLAAVVFDLIRVGRLNCGCRRCRTALPCAAGTILIGRASATLVLGKTLWRRVAEGEQYSRQCQEPYLHDELHFLLPRLAVAEPTFAKPSFNRIANLRLSGSGRSSRLVIPFHWRELRARNSLMI